MRELESFVNLDQVKRLHEDALRATGAFAESGSWDSDLGNVDESYINQGGNFLVGVLDNQVVAMGAYRRLTDTTAEVKRMRVRSDLQGRGIGRGLLAFLETEIKERDYVAIQLDTTVNQIAAQRLYETSGYTEIRRETEGWPFEVIFYHKDLI